MNSRFIFAMSCCALVGSLFQSGCGRGQRDDFERTAVTGQVTLDGHPLEQGVVRFVPIEQTTGPKTTVTVTEGRFKAPESVGPLVGTHRIEIESTDMGGYAMDDENALRELRQSRVKRIDVVTVPAVYNARSQLTETLVPDIENELIFKLESPARRGR